MTPAGLTLAAAERRLVERAQALAARIDAGDESAWGAYLPTISALHALTPPERRPLATTKEVAERFGVSERTARKRGRELGLTPVRLGKRGRTAIRWASETA